MTRTPTHPMLDLTPARHCARARAHIAGNEARRLEQQAARLLEQAADARRRYFRELATVDALGGELDSPFTPLGELPMKLVALLLACWTWSLLGPVHAHHQGEHGATVAEAQRQRYSSTAIPLWLAPWPRRPLPGPGGGCPVCSSAGLGLWPATGPAEDCRWRRGTQCPSWPAASEQAGWLSIHHHAVITYEQLLAEQSKHRAAFGWMLLRWRAANRWAIYDPSRLAESRGFRPVPYGLWQQLERGTAGELQSVTFMALGELNQHAPVPIGDWDGETTQWGPTEFWACYCGLRPVPARWRQP